MKLFLDDIRDPPDNTWTVARTMLEAKVLLESGYFEYKVLSLDHDLGKNTQTGYDLMKWIEKETHDNEYFLLPKKITIHSANPVGRKNMENAIRSIEKHTGLELLL